jgi:hypothetical protein
MVPEVNTLHESVHVGALGAYALGEGLHPKSPPVGHTVVGASLSIVKVNICEQVAVLPQPSVTVYIRVTVAPQFA